MHKVSRVLMTGDTVGGVWTYALELARGLGPHGVEVFLAALGGAASPAQRAEAANTDNLRVLESDFKLEWMEEPWADVEASGRWLLRLEQEYTPDLVHLNSYGHGALSWRAPVLLTAHSCVLSWWRSVKGEPAPAEWDRYRAEVAKSVRQADRVTAPSLAMARAVAALYGRSCDVVPNGRSAERYRSGQKEPVIFTAGRLWDEAKNVAAVVHAAPGLEWPVYLAGDLRRPDGRVLRAPGCRALGHLGPDEIAAWYARASIYVLPARYEPFGLSVLEAALSGCALVLGDIDSLREIWDGAAVFVPPEETEAVRDGLVELIRDPQRREELAGRAAERAREFTPERMARGYLDHYRALVARGRQVCA